MILLSRWLGRLFEFLGLCAALILLFMVLVVSADILLRNLGSRGFIWANEISEYALYFTTVLIAPLLLRKGQHIRLDVVLAMLPPRVAWMLEAIGDLFGIAVCAVFFRYSFLSTLDSWRSQSVTVKNLVFPEWWLLAPLPIVFALLAIEFCFRLQRLLSGERKLRVEATSAG
jgi:TRAP-type C4-dicarboxylate transport system permease small subunit